MVDLLVAGLVIEVDFMEFRKKNYKKIKIYSIEDFNKILEDIEKCCNNIFYRKKSADEYFKHDAFVWGEKTTLYVAYKRDYKTANTYYIRLDEVEDYHSICGMDAFRGLSISCNIQKAKDFGIDPDDLESSTGLYFKNKKYSNKRVKAYAYDVNSAFAYQLMQPLPDMATIRYNSTVKSGEVGFIVAPNNYFKNQQIFEDTFKSYLQPIFEVGRKCDVVFKLIESPCKKWVMNRYQEKLKAKRKGDKFAAQKAKDKLTYSIGMLQLYNPYWRACIIGRCNDFVGSFIDENTIYANTDSIYSAVRRPDIEAICGNEIGQFKIERENQDIAFGKTGTYQWNLEIPVARGVSKGWFANWEKINNRPYDLLVDTTPYMLNSYRLNRTKFRLEKIEYGQEN